MIRILNLETCMSANRTQIDRKPAEILEEIILRRDVNDKVTSWSHGVVLIYTGSETTRGRAKYRGRLARSQLADQTTCPMYKSAMRRAAKNCKALSSSLDRRRLGKEKFWFPNNKAA